MLQKYVKDGHEIVIDSTNAEKVKRIEAAGYKKAGEEQPKTGAHKLESPPFRFFKYDHPDKVGMQGFFVNDKGELVGHRNAGGEVVEGTDGPPANPAFMPKD